MFIAVTVAIVYQALSPNIANVALMRQPRHSEVIIIIIIPRTVFCAVVSVITAKSL